MFPSFKESGVLYESFDALFGLPRKKSSGMSVLEPVRLGLMCAEQQNVDNFCQQLPEWEFHWRK